MQEFEYFAMQLRLQRDMQQANPEAGTKDPYSMTEEELAVFVTWNMTALVKELSEATDEVGWKPWASSRFVQYPACIREMVDAWHFFMNMMLGMAAWAGVPLNDLAQEFESYYKEKNAKNLQRQVDGYDGVSQKCAFCHRELSEVPQSGRYANVDGNRFCNLDHSVLYYTERPGTVMSRHDPEEAAAHGADIEARSAALSGSGTADDLSEAAKRAHLKKQIEAQGGQMADGPPCEVPPEGWACSRGAGHDGPCAPYPIGAQSPAEFKDPAELFTIKEPGVQILPNPYSYPMVNPHAHKMVMQAELTGEPLFCFRARDFFSIQVIAFYANIVEQYGPDDADFHRNIVDALGEFKEWQKDHITEVRYPD
jgi:hypothetical protein